MVERDCLFGGWGGGGEGLGEVSEHAGGVSRAGKVGEVERGVVLWWMSEKA